MAISVTIVPSIIGLGINHLSTSRLASGITTSLTAFGGSTRISVKVSLIGCFARSAPIKIMDKGEFIPAISVTPPSIGAGSLSPVKKNINPIIVPAKAGLLIIILTGFVLVVPSVSNILMPMVKVIRLKEASAIAT